MAESQEKIHPVDAHVGKRLKLRRKSLDMSQEKLAASVGLTFQQVQKYENGANRISASRLYDIARVLEAPISYFFEGLSTSQENSYGLVREDQATYQTSFSNEAQISNINNDEIVELLNLYRSIASAGLRHQLLNVARALAGKA